MSMIEKIEAGGKVACFGSRETPADILKLMGELGAYIVDSGGIVASGHCHGADLAFETAASKVRPENVLVCLPWKGYNSEIPAHPKAKVEILTELPRDEQTMLMAEAEQYHGAWNRLTNGGRLLHTRNLLIGRNAIMGICYLNHSKAGGGGSGQCWRYLKHHFVEVYDLSQPGAFDELCEDLEI